MYTLFTDNQIFADPQANMLCNAIYTLFSDGEHLGSVYLTGTVAKIMQGDPSSPVKVISIQAATEEAFEYIKTVAYRLGPSGCVVLNDQIQMDFGHIFIEIWWMDVGATTTIDGMRLQHKDSIPSYIL